MVSSTVLLLLAPLKSLVVNACMMAFRQRGYSSAIGFALDLASLPVFSTGKLQAYTAVAYVCMLTGTAMQ